MKIFSYLAASLLLISCSNSSSDDFSGMEGDLSKRKIYHIAGFEQYKSQILAHQSVSPRDFIVWSTDSAWSLPFDAQYSLKKVRQAIDLPDRGTVLQKVISLEDIPVYMNNLYGGTIGGFVATAADVKDLSTMQEVFWGLRLDYNETKFLENGAGYGVIRFYSDVTSKLYIPFCSEMGGSQAHSWPNTGGGFTASKLSKGGYPEYVFSGYSAPRAGAELYEVTPQGLEILRSIYVDKKGWQTNEIGVPSPSKMSVSSIRNGIYSGQTKGVQEFVTTYAEYEGNQYIVRGEVEGEYHLTTTTHYPNVKGLYVVEKGIYGLKVPIANIHKIWEQTEPIH